MGIKEFLRGIGWSAWAVIALCLSLLVTLSWCSWEARRDARAQVEQLQADARLRDRERRAREMAADERLSDQIANAVREKELSDAVSHLPDARPSDRRVALACARLRQQGTPHADLPGPCRPEG